MWMSARKQMCVNIVHTGSRLGFQYRPIKVEPTFDTTIWELSICKRGNVDIVLRRMKQPLSTMRRMAQCLNKTIQLPASIDSSVHFLP